MKYPVLTVNGLPNLYKHCGKVFAFHMDFTDMGFMTEENQVQAQKYLEMVKRICYEQIESYFPMNAATRVYTKQETFVIFKETVNKKMLVDFAENLMTELHSYVGDSVQITYQVLKVILFEEGRNVKLTMMSKAGDDIIDSEAFKEATVFFQAKKQPRGKYFSSFEEYLRKHKTATVKQPVPVVEKKVVEAIPVPKKEEPVKEEPSQEEGYIYYI